MTATGVRRVAAAVLASIRAAGPALLAIAVLLGARPAAAHALNPALLALDEEEAGRVRVVWKLNIAETTVDAMVPDLHGCVEASPRIETHVGTGVVAGWTVHCDGGLAGREVAVHGMGGANEEAVLRVALADGRRFTTVLRDGDARFAIPRRPAPWVLVRSYAALGIRHIASGVDHLAFVLGLLLLMGPSARLLQAITGFTIAHSVTLALATLGVVHVPPRAVEALIALSILFLGLELARSEAARASWVVRRPWSVPFAFGLLHGLGFAGALADLGLAARDIPAALVAFNVGVEVGQVAFVLVALAVIAGVERVAAGWASLRRAAGRPATPSWSMRSIGAWAIGSAATFWTLDRVAAFWS